MNNDVDLELRERWIQALEDGTYEQGRTYLRRSNNTFCCLGVLADLNGVKWKQVGDFAYSYGNGRESLNAFIDTKTATKVGISKYVDKLADMNDDGYSFKEIAQFIRRRGIDNE